MTGHYHSRGATRAGWISLVWVAVFGLLLSGCDARSAKVYRLGILSGIDVLIPIGDGFKSKMTELGYMEEQNIGYDWQKVNVDPTANRRAAQKFTADKVDLIFAFPTDAALTAKAAAGGTSIPVVFAFSTIEGNDLVQSLRRPGGNVTGVRFPGLDVTAKRLELLLDLMPQLRRLWIAYDIHYPTTKSALDLLQRAESTHGITLVEVPATKVEDIQADLQARSQSNEIGMDAILIMPEDLSQSPASVIGLKGPPAR